VLKRITEHSSEKMAPLRWGQNYATRSFIICASASNDSDKSRKLKQVGQIASMRGWEICTTLYLVNREG